jgi:hypothetical protein
MKITWVQVKDVSIYIESPDDGQERPCGSMSRRENGPQGLLQPVSIYGDTMKITWVQVKDSMETP